MPSIWIFIFCIFTVYIYTNQTSEFLCNVSLLKTRYQSQSQKSWRKQWRPAFLFERKPLKDIVKLQLVLILQFDFRQSFWFFSASYIFMPAGGGNGFVQSLFMRFFCESFNDSLKRCFQKHWFLQEGHNWKRATVLPWFHFWTYFKFYNYFSGPK